MYLYTYELYYVYNTYKVFLCVHMHLLVSSSNNVFLIQVMGHIQYRECN
jgi:hypothetical protein